MQKISFIFGTRPEAIKLAPLIRVLKEDKAFDVEVCTTGQHREMLQQVLDIFEIKPDTDLALMVHNQGLPDFMARSIAALNKHLEESKPDYVIVQGDTSTVLAASMSAFYHKIKVLHVEAGLRTADLYSPFPEEMNRRLTTQLSFFHFAPTPTASTNLVNEGTPGNKILVTGNTSIDAIRYTTGQLEKGQLKPSISVDVQKKMGEYAKMVLITGHRRESFGEGFINICKAIRESAETHKDCLFIYPVHLNPNVQEVVFGLLNNKENILLIPPQSYVEFVYLMMKSDIILTDSGGVQEEGPSFHKPILVMRENTERPEGIAAGCSLLVGTSPERITSEITRLLKDASYYDTFRVAANPYGDGTASQKIAAAIRSWNN
ncbi:non-hydrolyzing UDP-N-acetylglucosamine 2-epimerase [Pseudoflavitalea rhizosphaerae]|uniref:non-hydrolyzing UDP-N-acetylglucosamine 2-epimerase n=1 Tax=Pseudoflavitalea rhizosphaerae TaxID=1884793 RepID=UPI000F8F0651|nr:UDP-N-acetylglucosamine 2-epimerase (non-hydrolyzing) [Pseudoflavitalea rhizosphaerae]